MTTLKIQVIQELTMNDVANLVITAFEGGISYWCPSAKAVARISGSGWQSLEGERYDAQRIDGCGPYANPSFWENRYHGYVLYHDPDEDGHFQPIMGLDGVGQRVMTANRIGASLNRMVRDGHGNVDIVNRVLSGDYDANDADVVIQYCMFDEVVYG